MKTSTLRFVAAAMIDEVMQGRSLSDCLESSLKTIDAVRDRAWVQAVCYGVCRFYTRLEFILAHLLKKPLKAKDSDLQALLLVGIYQLMAMRIPPHAAVTETVNAIDQLNKPWARGLVNAVLREYLRKREAFSEQFAANEEAFYAHPRWWIEKIKAAWPNQWQDILHANNAHPPFALRVNQRHISRDDYIDKLRAQHYSAQMIAETQSGLILESPVATEKLPGFAEGWVSVQDGAAQLAAGLLDLHPKQRVLDACAAPGGKLTHNLESEPHLDTLVAIDKDPQRVELIKENLQRLQLQAHCLCQEITEINHWWDGKTFDRILLDVPCSASGVIRRHPDIKLLRHPNDIQPLVDQQQHMLNTLWHLLTPGGLLVYATCSIFPEENVQLLQHFFNTHAEATEEKIAATWGIACQIGRQILPGMQHMDGFYYARVRKC